MVATPRFTRVISAAVATTILLTTNALTALAGESTAGKIAGYLCDAQGQPIRPGHAVVFLGDAISGAPLFKSDVQIPADGFGRFFAYLKFDDFRYAVTDDRGAFEFTDVPPGKYRLVAQAWSGTSGMPRAIVGSHSDSSIEPSSTIVLFGTAESVDVKPGEQAMAMVKQWGDSSLRINTDPAEPHNYLIISRTAPLGDPVLGPTGWGPEFAKNIIGITRAEDPSVTLVGLPEGTQIHVALFNYDNNPGIGGGSLAVKSGQPATIPIYASWSNGKYDPPPHLLKLTEYLEKNPIDIYKRTAIGETDSTGEHFRLVWAKANSPIELAGYGTVRTIDLLAAGAFRERRASHRKRNAANKD